MILRTSMWYAAMILLVLHVGCGSADKGSSNDIPGEQDSTVDRNQDDDFHNKVSTYEDNNRDIWQKPDRVIDLLAPLEDKTVVDLGAGSGYFAFRLVPKAKKVIAVDIDEDFIDFLNSKRLLLPETQQERFEVRLAKKDDPMIESGEADAVLIVNTYAYLEDRVEYFKNLLEDLKPNAKLVIIEFKMKNIPNGPPVEEKVAISTVEKELSEAGFIDIDVDDQTLDYQYIVTARSR
ncbi:MAG: class I SAM-dependent methyltransferase [Saprospiraceae bacterium]|nr:class I SAM-dependent methyltransferase [Saprospiraceae bacterium]